MNRQEILDKQRKYLWPNHLLYYTDPMPLDHGEGLYVWDVDGNKYLDFFGGILTTSVGHNHPRVVDAAQQQTAKLIHSSTLYPNENHVKLAEKIAEIAPGDLETSYFHNSGSEANEAAVLLAQLYTGRREIIALRHGYSGKTQLAMSLTAQSSWRMGPTFSPDIKHAHNAYCFRCPLKLEYPSCGVACAEDIEDVIRTQTTGTIAAVLMEPIQGVGGFVTPPPEYFGIVAEIARDHGGVVIIDEVQTGFGRTGGHWFGIEHWDVQPDIMTMAKGIANGFPLSNCITRAEIAEAMKGAGLTISTFGGNPVSTAASLATIEVIEEEAPPSHVQTVGDRLRAGLDRFWEKYPLIGEVRGKGLMQGIEMVTDPQSKEPAVAAVAQLFEETRARGLLIGKGGMYGNVIRIAPPLTATEAHVDEALMILDAALAQVHETQGVN
ncbi:MAG: aspartate aminotransferase family protein [Caldilineaceae bacterium]|nr:aspartate aminotransferase family protein [Caldilineaceae bacterium]